MELRSVPITASVGEDPRSSSVGESIHSNLSLLNNDLILPSYLWELLSDCQQTSRGVVASTVARTARTVTTVARARMTGANRAKAMTATTAMIAMTGTSAMMTPNGNEDAIRQQRQQGPSNDNDNNNNGGGWALLILQRQLRWGHGHPRDATMEPAATRQ